MARDTIPKKIYLNRDTIEWFQERYPDSSLQGIISLLFEKFREVSTITPSEYAHIAAESLREDFSSEKKE